MEMEEGLLGHYEDLHALTKGSASTDVLCSSPLPDSVISLHQVWKEIGLSEEEIDEQLKSLLHDVDQLYKRKLHHQQETKRKLQEEVEAYLERIRTVMAQLGQYTEIEMSKTFLEAPLATKCSVLRARMLSLEEEKREQLGCLEVLHNRLHALWEELGAKEQRNEAQKFAIIGDDLSSTRVEAYENQIKLAEKEKAARLERVDELIFALMELWSELGVVKTEFDQTVLDQTIGIFSSALSALEDRKNQLLQLKENRKQHLVSLERQIEHLWDRFNVPVEQRDSFFADNGGLGPAVVEAYEAELVRLKDILRTSLREMILKARETITKQWNELGISEKERLQFRPLYSEAFTDTLLEAHDEEIAKNNVKLKVMRPILKKIEEREKILQQKSEFEATSTDPTRLLSKKRDPGRLLREEKFRKLLRNRLPILERELLAELSEWESTHGCPFSYQGKDYLSLLKEQKELEEKEERQASVRRKLEKSQKLQDSQQVSQFLSPAKPATRRTATTPQKTKGNALSLTPGLPTSRSRTPLASRQGVKVASSVRGNSVTPNGKRPREALQPLTNVPFRKQRPEEEAPETEEDFGAMSPLNIINLESPPKKQKRDI